MTLPAVALGAGGAFALEALLSLRATRVRAVWERPAVQAAAVVVGLLGCAVAVVLLPVAATVFASGLCAYLLLLAAMTLFDVLGR